MPGLAWRSPYGEIADSDPLMGGAAKVGAALDAIASAEVAARDAVWNDGGGAGAGDGDDESDGYGYDALGGGGDIYGIADWITERADAAADVFAPSLDMLAASTLRSISRPGQSAPLLAPLLVPLLAALGCLRRSWPHFLCLSSLLLLDVVVDPSTSSALAALATWHATPSLPPLATWHALSSPPLAPRRSCLRRSHAR